RRVPAACSRFDPPRLILYSSFLLYSSPHHRPLHSFPTRRSSDLTSAAAFQSVGLVSPTPMLRIMLSESNCFRVIDQAAIGPIDQDRKSTRLNSSHSQISYAVFCLKKKKTDIQLTTE